MAVHCGHKCHLHVLPQYDCFVVRRLSITRQTDARHHIDAIISHLQDVFSFVDSCVSAFVYSSNEEIKSVMNCLCLHEKNQQKRVFITASKRTNQNTKEKCMFFGKLCRSCFSSSDTPYLVARCYELRYYFHLTRVFVHRTMPSQ